MWWPNTLSGIVMFYLSYKGRELKLFYFVMGLVNLGLGYWIGSL